MLCKYITLFIVTSPVLFLTHYLRIKESSLYYYIQIVYILITIILLQEDDLIQLILQYWCKIFKVCCNV